MNRFYIRAGFVLLLLILFSVIGFSIYSIFFSSQTHMMTYVDKIERIKSIKDRKAIFIGGSGTHFGVSAELFEMESKIKSVNMGVHASISMDTYLTDVSRYLNKDDILFIIPEYDYYCTEWRKFDSQNMEFSVLYSKNISHQLFASFDAFPNMIYTGWGEWANILKQCVSLAITGKTTDKYKRNDSNKWGDFIAYKPSGGGISSSYEKFDQIDIHAMNCLLNTIHNLEKKGVMVYILFPPYIDYAFHDNEKIINESFAFLSNNKVKMLFCPNNSRYEKSLFYDTVYHLNMEGKKKYTNMILSLIQKKDSIF